MNGPIFKTSIPELENLIERLLKMIKDVFAWLGILLLPEEGNGDGYEYPGEDNSPVKG